MGSSNRPRSAISTCFTISGTNRISRAVVSGTGHFRQAPDRKKKTILDRSSASLSWGRDRIRMSLVKTAHPPSRSRSFIQSISAVLAGYRSLKATNVWSGNKCCSERGIAGLRLWSTSNFKRQADAQNREQLGFRTSVRCKGQRPLQLSLQPLRLQRGFRLALHVVR